MMFLFQCLNTYTFFLSILQKLVAECLVAHA